MGDLMRSVSPLLTIEETAEFLGVSVTTVRKYISEDKLKTFKMQRVVRIPKTELEAFIVNQMADGRNIQDAMKGEQ